MGAWMATGAQLQITHDCLSHVFNLPINILSLAAGDEAFVPFSARLLACGIKLVRHVINPTTGTWIAVNDLSQVIPRARPLSRRLLNSDLQRLHSVLVSMFPSFFNSKGFLHAPALLLCICHQPDLPLNIKISSNIKGLSAPSKLIYAIINSTLNHLPEYTITFWHLQGFLDKDNEIQWKQIYELPTRKKQGTCNLNFCTTSSLLSQSFNTSTPTSLLVVDGAVKGARSGTCSSPVLLFNQRSTYFIASSVSCFLIFS